MLFVQWVYRAALSITVSELQAHSNSPLQLPQQEVSLFSIVRRVIREFQGLRCFLRVFHCRPYGASIINWSEL